MGLQLTFCMCVLDQSFNFIVVCYFTNAVRSAFWVAMSFLPPMRWTVVLVAIINKVKKT
jgi:hypothetical protein